MPILTINNLSKSFGSDQAVKNISFNLHNKSCTALIGPNGAGKTTILKILTGIINKTAGEITFHHQGIIDHRSLIGYLPQHPVFHSWMTGEEFLIYSGRLTKLSKKEAKKRADILLEKVGILEAKKKRISTYSGGMKQRLGLAQALIHKPPVILLDEPVSALDPIGRRDVLTLMETLKQEMTILFSTHILADAEEISDDVLLLHDGKLVESGTMKQLRKKYQTAKIELQFVGDLADYTLKIEQLPNVLKCKIIRNTIHVSVKNIEQARNEILKYVSDHNLALTRFMINEASLENMFMKVVNK